MSHKFQYEKQLTPANIEMAKLLINIWNEHDMRNFGALKYSVGKLFFLLGAHNSMESSTFVANAYKIHGNWDDDPEKPTKVKLFGNLNSIWSVIENELKKALKTLGVKYSNKSAYHHTCWWMYYSALNSLKEDAIRGILRRYLYYALALWHIFSDQLIKTGSYIGSIKCTYLLYKGAKYSHGCRQYELGTKYLARYWYISQKYNRPVYMF